VLIVLSGFLRDRQLGRATGGTDAAAVTDGPRRSRGHDLPEASSTRAPKQEPVVDDDMAEIEALLKKRGIQ
jgi:hypothetical protein